MERIRQKQMKLDELTQLGWSDTANYFAQRDRKCRTTELKVPAIDIPQMNNQPAASASTTIGKLMSQRRKVRRYLGIRKEDSGGVEGIVLQKGEDVGRAARWWRDNLVR